MIFPSIAENQENMIFTLSVFTKTLFFMQCLIAELMFMVVLVGFDTTISVPLM